MTTKMIVKFLNNKNWYNFYFSVKALKITLHSAEAQVDESAELINIYFINNVIALFVGILLAITTSNSNFTDRETIYRTSTLASVLYAANASTNGLKR